MNKGHARRQALRPVFSTTGNPYAARLFDHLLLDVAPGDIRGAFDAARLHPEVIAMKAQASGRFESEALIGSTADLVRRSMYAALRRLRSLG